MDINLPITCKTGNRIKMILFYLGGTLLLPISLFNLMTLEEERTIIDTLPGAIGVTLGLTLTMFLIIYLVLEYGPTINCKCNKS